MGPSPLVLQTSYRPVLPYYTTVPYAYLLFHTTPYYSMLCHTIPCYAILFHAMPSILFHAMPYYSILFHTMPYYFYLEHVQRITFCRCFLIFNQAVFCVDDGVVLWLKIKKSYYYYSLLFHTMPYYPILFHNWSVFYLWNSVA